MQGLLRPVFHGALALFIVLAHYWYTALSNIAHIHGPCRGRTQTSMICQPQDLSVYVMYMMSVLFISVI